MRCCLRAQVRLSLRGGLGKCEIGVSRSGNFLKKLDAEKSGGGAYLRLGWAYLNKAVRKPQRRGVNFDPPMIFVLVLCKILQVLPKYSRTAFAENKKF